MNLTKLQKQDFSTVYDYLHIESQLPAIADAIVVGGSGPRTDMADRAAELYHKGISKLIIFSGFAHPDFGTNEAKLLANRAMELGVPAACITQESRATNSGLNIVLSARTLAEKGITPTKIVLVHKPYMTRRFLATAEAQWPQPQPALSVTAADMSFDEYLQIEATQGLADYMLASILKNYMVIKIHPAKGYSTPQTLNERAEAAYQRLIASGVHGAEPNESLSTERNT